MATNQNDKRPLLRYFISYEHKHDSKPKQDLMDRLQANFASAKNYRFEIWDDGEIDPGDDWHDRIQGAIRNCDFGLLLVSKYFLQSKYIKEHELPAFIQPDPSQNPSTKHAIPVALKRLDFSGNTDLKGLEQRQVFMHGDKSFSEYSTDNTKEKFVDTLFQKIMRIVERRHPTNPAPTPQNGKNGQNPVNNPGNGSTQHTVCDAIRSEIREAIKKLLGKPALQEVRKALINAQAEPRLDPEAWLVPCGAGPFPIEEKIDTLHDAVRDGLQAVKEGQPHLLKPARDDAKEALERLLVLAVPDAWAQIGTQHLGSGQRKVEIPEKLPLWAEVGQGRVNGNCPQLALKEDGIGVFAPNHLDHDELERGLTHQDALMETLRLIWLKVQKCEPPTDLNWQRQLSKTLVRRAKDGERYHITIPHDRYAAISANPVWAEKLGDTLAHFGIFVYATGVGDPVLIVPEDDLLVAIREYLRLLRKYE